MCPCLKTRKSCATRSRWMRDAILHGDASAQRRAIAKAITLLESTRAQHRAQGDALLTALLPYTGKSLRLGFSGVPGVGKSTLIEALGLYLIDQGRRVAVLNPGRQDAHGKAVHARAGVYPPQPEQRHAGRRGRKDPRGHAGVRSGGL